VRRPSRTKTGQEIHRGRENQSESAANRKPAAETETSDNNENRLAVAKNLTRRTWARDTQQADSPRLANQHGEEKLRFRPGLNLTDGKNS
jgi:hypothetical protein